MIQYQPGGHILRGPVDEPGSVRIEREAFCGARVASTADQAYTTSWTLAQIDAVGGFDKLRVCPSCRQVLRREEKAEPATTWVVSKGGADG